jgi:uncharacterized repeat protein (TIGR02543 family)
MKKVIHVLLLLAIVYLVGACDIIPTPAEEYRVFFKDYDMTVLSSQKVKENDAAIAPEDPTREGYTFIGWDKDFSNVTENMEIIALYKINKYTVTFVDYDGTVLKTEEVAYKESATAPEDPVRVGHQFVGWDHSFINVTKNLTITALYEISTVTVTFVDSDGTVLKIEEIIFGGDATPPTIEDRLGRTFVGWDKDYTNVIDNLTITAQYEVDVFTVIFYDHDGSVIKTENVEYGKDASAPSDPVRVGYKFIGWDKDYTNVTSDLTVTALYEVLTFTVKFVDRDGAILKSETVEYGKDATPPTVEDKPGYLFLGWDKDFTNITEDLIINAQYDIETFIVKFVDHDGTLLKEETVEYGKDATPPTELVREGYEFAGWDLDYTNVTTNLTVKAQYEVITFTVKFVDIDGTVLKTEEVEYGKDATAPSIDEKPGHTFTGWDKDYTNVKEDLIITAQYIVETFTVTFYDLDDIVLKTETIEYGKAATAPDEPDHLGYIFIKWDKEFAAVTEDLEVRAVYETIEYQITYHKNATHVAEVAWPNKEAFLQEFYTDLFNWVSDNASKISSLTKNGSTFIMTRYDRTATWSNVAELRALDIYDFERTLGSLIYKPFTRVNNEPIIPEVDENYFLNSEPYRSKYIDFDAYFLNACIVGYPAYDRGYNQASYGRVQIFFRFHQWAKGTNIPSFDNYPKKHILTENENVVLPTTHLKYTIVDEFDLPAATCEDMTFLGWFDNPQGAGEPITKINKGSHGDIDLYAKWDDDLSTHKVIFLDETGKVIDTIYLTPGEAITPPTYTPKLGYRFVSWDKDITNITSDLVITAKIEIIVYTITYHDNLEDVEAELPTEPVTYTIHDRYVLPDAYLEGYLFLGWYDNPECEGLAITETSHGDLELYAYFIKIPGEGETIGDGSVELVATEQVVQVNRSTQVYAKMGDVYIKSQNLHYISTNEAIASIDGAGFVRAKAEGEVVIIVVTSSTVAAIKLIVVAEPYQVKWVGHQGSGGPVVQNTVSAFHEGGRRGYYAMECDVRVSSDGVYYICHDDVFKSSLFVDSSLWDKPMGSYTWNQLKDLQVKDTYGGQTYYGTLATVEEYLLICKQYGAKAVLELKWTNGINSNDQSRLAGLVELVKQCGMYENAIFLSSMKNCLTYIREHYPDANIQFLSGTSTTTIENINWCIENKFSLDAPHNLITVDIVNRMHNAYLYVNGYTVNDSATSNKLQNYLVDMITTDNLGV